MAAQRKDEAAVPAPPPDPFAGFDGYTKPGWTQVSNEFLDRHVRLLGGAEVKVMLILFRETVGYDRRSYRLSAKQIAKQAGLTRRHVQLTVASLEHKGLITVERNETALGDPAANRYTIRWRRENRATPDQNFQG